MENQSTINYLKLFVQYLSTCIGIYVLHYFFLSRLKFEYFQTYGYFLAFLTNIIATTFAAVVMILIFKNRKQFSISISITKSLVFMCIFLAFDLLIIFLVFGKNHLYDYTVNDIPYAIQKGFLLELFWLIHIRKCV